MMAANGANRFPGEEVSHSNSSCPNVCEMVPRDLDLGAANADFDPVVTNVLDCAIGHRATLGIIQEQGARNFNAGLQRRSVIRGRLPFRVREGQTLKTYVVHWCPRAASDSHELRQTRCDHFNGGHLLSW